MQDAVAERSADACDELGSHFLVRAEPVRP